MVTIPPVRMIGGVFTTPMEAGPDDFVASKNLHNVNGVLQKRAGMVSVMQYGKYATSTYLGFAEYPAEPASVTNGTATPADNSETTLYVGGSSPFRQFHIFGEAQGPATWAAMIGNWTTLRDAGVEYWNGTAWAAVNCADLFRTLHTSGTSPLITLNGPFRAWYSDVSGSANMPDVMQVRGILEPPEDWVAKDIGGRTDYWLRVVNITGGYAVSVSGADSYTQLQDNPILHQLYFSDRRGTAHSFVVVKYDATLLKYYLDGAELTPSDGLQPDGASKMFSDRTKVWSYYDSSTDRIIGHVEGLGWFYAISTNNGEIYSLVADDVATLSGYENVVGGLRTVIPPGVISCTHDDRIWTFNGNLAVYSSPGVYKDIWPNDNELSLNDGAGNITAAGSVGGVLAIFMRNSIWVAQSDGSADGYIAYRLPGNVGCVAPRSVVAAGNHLWFLAEDGIYMFDGQGVTKKSRRIDGLLVKGLASSDMTAAIGVWFPLYNQYRLYYPGPDSLPWVCSDALYCAADGGGDLTFWPQGKNATGDYGFNATSVVTDQTTDSNRVMLGDRYGCIWEMDKGLYDGTSPVTFSGTTHRMALGAGQKVLLRWVTPTTRSLTNNAWTCSAIMDGDTYNKQTLSLPGGGENPAAAFHAVSTVEATSTVYANSFDMQSTASGSVQGMGRFFQLEISDAVAQPWELEAVALELNRFGRRG